MATVSVDGITPSGQNTTSPKPPPAGGGRFANAPKGQKSDKGNSRGKPPIPSGDSRAKTIDWAFDQLYKERPVYVNADRQALSDLELRQELELGYQAFVWLDSYHRRPSELELKKFYQAHKRDLGALRHQVGDELKAGQFPRRLRQKDSALKFFKDHKLFGLEHKGVSGQTPGKGPAGTAQAAGGPGAAPTAAASLGPAGLVMESMDTALHAVTSGLVGDQKSRLARAEAEVPKSVSQVAKSAGAGASAAVSHGQADAEKYRYREEAPEKVSVSQRGGVGAQVSGEEDATAEVSGGAVGGRTAVEADLSAKVEAQRPARVKTEIKSQAQTEVKGKILSNVPPSGQRVEVEGETKLKQAPAQGQVRPAGKSAEVEIQTDGRAETKVELKDKFVKKPSAKQAKESATPERPEAAAPPPSKRGDVTLPQEAARERPEARPSEAGPGGAGEAGAFVEAQPAATEAESSQPPQEAQAGRQSLDAVEPEKEPAPQEPGAQPEPPSQEGQAGGAEPPVQEEPAAPGAEVQAPGGSEPAQPREPQAPAAAGGEEKEGEGQPPAEGAAPGGETPESAAAPQAQVPGDEQSPQEAAAPGRHKELPPWQEEPQKEYSPEELSRYLDKYAKGLSPEERENFARQYRGGPGLKKLSKPEPPGAPGGAGAAGAQAAAQAAPEIAEDLKRGDVKAAGEAAVKAGAQVGFDRAFYYLLAAIIPSFGLAILGLDLLWLIAIIAKVKLAFWQKLVIAALTFLLALIIVVAIAVFTYTICNQPLVKYGSKLASYFTSNEILTFCEKFNNFQFSGTPGRGDFGGGGASSGFDGPLDTGKWKNDINAASQKYNISPCILDTILKKESSGGDPNAIGHDNHDGKTDSFQRASPPFYGLNWQYSHGIGITQVTIFPSGYRGVWPAWPPDGRPVRVSWGRNYYVEDLLNPQISIDWTGHFVKDLSDQFKGDTRSIFRAYNGSGPKAEAYADDAMRLYNICISQK